MSNAHTARNLALAAAAVLASCLTPRPPGASDRASTPAGTPGSPQANVRAIAYSWKSVVITGGGFVTGLLYSPVKAGILYARTDIGGAYRYDPEHESWIPLTDFVSQKDSNYLGIESIAVDPVDPGRVYLAVGMYTQPWAGPGAFMRSDDRGSTWRVFPTPLLKMGGNENGRSNGERLAVDPHQRKILFFGSRRRGLWKSVNEAESFSQVESFPVKDDAQGLGISFVLFDPSTGKPGETTPLIYTGVSRFENNLYRSADSGESWQLVPKQPTGFMPARAALDRDGTLYVTYGNDPGPYAVQNGALYRYDPKRELWTDISPLKPSAADGFGFGAVTVDPSRPGTLLATTIDRWTRGGEVFRTKDGGKTWKALMAKAVIDSGGVPHVYHHHDKLDAPQWMGDIKIDPFAPSRAMVIDGGGIYATVDLTEADSDKPTHWSFHAKNLEETAVRGLVSPPEGPPLLSAIGDLCGFRHDSLDQSPAHGNFENPTCASGDALDFAEKKPRVVVRVGTYPWDNSKGPRGASSNDGGLTWTEFGSEPAGSNGSGSVVVAADGGVIVWAPKDARVSYSADRGATWSPAEGLPEPAKVADWAPVNLRLAADRVNPKKLYAFDALTGTAYWSEDGGAHFKQGTGGLPSLPDYDLISGSIQAVPGFEGDVWITSGKELIHSTDSGKSFTLVTSAEESYALGFGRAAPGHRYPALYLSGKVGGLVGFFASDDGGERFARINDDAHQYGGSHLIIGDPRVYGRVYIAAGGRGILYGDPQ